ncbi:MAG: gliding motility-associated ABC transporter permease subunit GldF [Gammaproteobacteria bacterium]|nr:gliding motility-associated ABC transporter permease subunit GldF [Bacteroidia bacterium]NNC69136.1 gliding motility-associated ABC transporter permease subunit GldF [Gammaproteobacteria bacterium]
MLQLLSREINGFLNSLIGALVISIFLICISLFLWVFPDTGFNILNSGYANLDAFFIITPWIYLFLIPAITMRLFAEEKRSGTIELLLTRPFSELQIILTKFWAGVILVLISLIPTLIYYYTVYKLGAPEGNLDSGSIWGSYLGLLLLGACFVAIGLFASSITDNQVVAFIVALFLSFICYTGFESLSSIISNSSISHFIYQLGINAHYKSLSRGVIDTRDLLYFISATLFFIMVTKLVLESRKWA